MPEMQRRPGRKVTRQIERPMPGILRGEPSDLAAQLMAAHNAAVRAYGSDSGGFCAFEPTTRSWSVWDGSDGFPNGTVVTRLAWGRLDARLAQRLLEGDGLGAAVTEPKE
jgi:hypothetical protein